MRILVITALIVAAAATSQNYFKLPSPYSFQCKNQNDCVRTPIAEATGEIQSEAACHLTCGEYASLFPQPTGATKLSGKVVHFNPYNMQVTKIAASNQVVADMLDDATRYFKRNVHFTHPEFPANQKTPFTEEVQVTFEDVNQQQAQRPFRFSQGDRFNQRQEKHQQFSERHNEQAQNEFMPFETQTFEEWERYSPFRTQEFNARVNRQQVNLEITVTSPEHKLSIENTDESYNLVVQTLDDETTVTILATTYYGARHALESLSQLIDYDDNEGDLAIVSDANINDQPQYKFRGLSVDTSRNFYTKSELMTLLDAMSQNKMNVLQWHINDAASFPLYTNRVPQMSYYGAYSPRKVYYREDVQEIVQYAKLRGINVVPEFTAPGHTAAGWDWGEREGLGALSLCTKQKTDNGAWFDWGKESPSGQLNPTNPKVYDVLGEIYKDMAEYFDPEMFHMGGDGVSFKCWQNSPEIQEYLAKNGREPTSREYFELWNTFQTNAYSKLQEATGPQIKPIIHSSSFARNYLNKDEYTIQLSCDDHNCTGAPDYINNGFTVIFSNFDEWRLDCTGTTWSGETATSCPEKSPTWENFYENSPLDVLYNLGVSNARSDQSSDRVTTNRERTQQTGEKSVKERVLGGITTLRSAETDGQSFESKVFPKVSAFAERLWSDPSTSPIQNDAKKRLSLHRNRMVYRGIRADPIQPQYCQQHEGSCYSETEYRQRSEIRQ